MSRKTALARIRPWGWYNPEYAEDIPRFSRRIAALLAGVSPATVRYAEARGWIRPKLMPGGGMGYSLNDVRTLRRIREWREVLGLNTAGIEVAFYLREQVVHLQEELFRLEEEMVRREQALHAEIRRLRQLLAEEGRWTDET